MPIFKIKGTTEMEELKISRPCLTTVADDQREVLKIQDLEMYQRKIPSVDHLPDIFFLKGIDNILRTLAMRDCSR